MTMANNAGSAWRMRNHILETSTRRRARYTKRALIRSPNQTRQGKALPVLLSDFTKDFFGLSNVLGDLIRERLKASEGLLVSQALDKMHFDCLAQKVA